MTMNKIVAILTFSLALFSTFFTTAAFCQSSPGSATIKSSLDPGVRNPSPGSATIKSSPDSAIPQSPGDSTEKWTTHFQLTTVYQSHQAFHPKYSGPNSLDTAHEEAYSLTTTLFIGRRLWKGTALYFNPEMTGGSGLSKTTGIAGFPNG